MIKRYDWKHYYEEDDIIKNLVECCNSGDLCLYSDVEQMIKQNEEMNEVLKEIIQCNRYCPYCGRMNEHSTDCKLSKLIK